MEAAGYAFGPVVLPAAGVGAPHTDDTGFSSWPTPCGQDGPNGGPTQGEDRLPGAAALCGWQTPTCPSRTADGHQAGNNRYVTSVVDAGTVEHPSEQARVSRLARERRATGGHWADADWLTVPGRKVAARIEPGTLQLMGLPAEWTSCAPLETRSAAKSPKRSSGRTSKVGAGRTALEGYNANVTGLAPEKAMKNDDAYCARSG